MKRTHALTTAALLAGACSLAQAQSDFYRRVNPVNASEGGTVGLAVLSGRQYQGSDESRVRALPSIEYQWSNGFFAGVQSGVGYNASKQSDLDYGVRITADFGRDESRSSALAGMGDVEFRPQLGAFFNYNPLRSVSLNSSVRWGTGNERKGLLVDLGVSWSTGLSPSLRVGTSLATTWANAQHTQEYFGVNTAQAARSGYALYAPKAGLRDLRLGVSAIYRVAPAWSVTGTLTRAQLQGDAKRSPLVREAGSTSAVLAVGYSF